MRRKRTGLFAAVVSMLLATVLAFALVGCGEAKTYTLSLSVDGANMKVGEEISVSVGANYDLGAITWATSNAEVATVSGGKIKAVGVGTADVTAATTDPAGAEHKLACTVYVTAGDVTEATYKVEIYRQKKDRSGYELDETASVTKTATLDKEVTANAALYGKVGYVFDENNAGNVISGTVTADNATALKLYYNIKTFTVTFKAEGAADVVRTVDYGDTLTDIPEVPEKDGKSGKWDVTAFDNITSDITVRALYANKEVTLKFVVGGEDYRTIKLAYGASLAASDVPAVPEKFGYNGAWDVTDFSEITADTTVTAVYTLKKLAVAFENEDGSAHGTSLEITAFEKITDDKKPADPTKAADQDCEYDFVGWKVKGTDNIWDFDNDTVTEDIILVAVFDAVELHTVTITVTGEKVDIPGVEAPLFMPTAEQLSGVAAGVIDRGDITVKVDNGVASFRARSGEYTVRVAKGNYTTDVVVSVNEGNATAYAYLIPQDVKVGGKAGNYDSFGGNWTKDGVDAVTLTSVSYVFVDATNEELSTRYYYEADVDFPGCGKVVGFMAAHVTDKALSGGGNKIGFSFSGGNTIYWYNSNGLDQSGFNSKWGPFINVHALGKADQKHKFAILRDNNDYYMFVNDKLAGVYTCADYGASSFGFFAQTEATSHFSNIRYTRRAETVDAILAEFAGTDSANLGGAVTYSDNTAIDTFNAGVSLTGRDSGRIGLGSTPSYIINGGKAGSVYYAEAEFTPSHANNWVGIMINTSDKAPSSSGVWYGYGCGYGQIYRHSTASWGEGTSLGAFNIGSTFKLGVARINDRYYVFLDDKLVITEQYSVVSGKDNSKTLAADNESGFGIFIGSNTDKDATFRNFRCTTDLSKIAAIIGSSTVSFDSEVVEVKQLGKTIGENGTVIVDAPVEFTVTVPAGKKIGDINIVTTDGASVTPSISGSTYSFTPAAGTNYTISVSYVSEGTGSLNLTVKSVTKTVGDDEFALYENIDPSKVTVTVRNMTTGAEDASTLTAFNKTYENLDNGMYVVEIEYMTNVYSYNVVIDGGEVQLTGFVSTAYLGGHIELNGETYKSYKNIPYTDIAGAGWALVDGKRDTAKLTGYTFLYQHQAVGKKYYVEGVFDANETAYDFSKYNAGLMVSHGPGSLNDNTQYMRFVAGIHDRSLIVTSYRTGWSMDDTRILAHLDDVFPEGYDASKVKLGVARDENWYYFFVNDTFVCKYYYEAIPTVSGFGLIGGGANVNVTISNFNYSLNASLVDALKAQAPETTDKSIDLYFIAGQSNASGYSNWNYNEAKDADENLVNGFSNVLYAGDGDSVLDPDKTKTNGWQYTRIGLGGNGQRFGAEAGMAQVLSSYYNKESGNVAGIIKSAHGGTSLLDAIGGQNEPGGNWVSPSYEAALGTVQEKGGRTGGCYRSFIAQVRLNISQLQKMGYTKFNFKGLFWMQGESDRGNPTEYVRAFKFLVQDFRNDLGEIATEVAGTEVDLSNMPVIVGEISKYTSGGESGMNETFIATQRTFPDIINDCYVVNSSQFDVRLQDNWHWIQPDMLKIGNMVGGCILENVLR